MWCIEWLNEALEKLTEETKKNLATISENLEDAWCNDDHENVKKYRAEIREILRELENSSTCTHDDCIELWTAYTKFD